MDKHELAVMRGEEAERILGSAVYAEAFNDVRAALLNTWAALDTTEERYAEFAKDLHRRVKCLDAVRSALTERISTGKINQKTIEAGIKRPSTFANVKNAFTR